MAPLRTVALPSQDELRNLFRYDAETGQLFWQERPAAMFKTEDNCRGWNVRFAGKEALTHVNHGHRRGLLFRQSVYAHRIIWKMMTGNDVAEIDHIDGNPLNNAWRNLRPAANGANQKNCPIRKDNRSRCVGVVQRGSRWIAQIGISGTTKHIGIFDKWEDAMVARKAAEREYGFHPNHGRK